MGDNPPNVYKNNHICTTFLRCNTPPPCSWFLANENCSGVILVVKSNVWRLWYPIIYWGFHEKGTHSYRCPQGIDRLSPLNECTLQVPFIWNPGYVCSFTSLVLNFSVFTLLALLTSHVLNYFLTRITVIRQLAAA